jgi:hypothetical protein
MHSGVAVGDGRLVVADGYGNVGGRLTKLTRKAP